AVDRALCRPHPGAGRRRHPRGRRPPGARAQGRRLRAHAQDPGRGQQVRRLRALGAALAAATLAATCAGGPLGARRTLLPAPRALWRAGGGRLRPRGREGFFRRAARFKRDRAPCFWPASAPAGALLDSALCRELALGPGGATTLAAPRGARGGGRRLPPLPVL